MCDPAPHGMVTVQPGNWYNISLIWDFSPNMQSFGEEMSSVTHCTEAMLLDCCQTCQQETQCLNYLLTLTH